ncbi:MAG: amidohydrolase family protein [Acidimicrobiia bacterium]|nr:amidohydrolase family protein [Acidimicrobiia bacterium]
MHDVVVRGGRIVDGTGQDAFVGDVAIDGDRISAVGQVDAKGRREIDAEGHLVTPGWVDIHTHYDGQATWDSELAPSSIHGVTSVVMGNCGVGFAPARPGLDEHEMLIELMEGVEDIPGTALHEGLRWDWESLPQYFDALDRTPHTIDIGAQVPHAALRAYVMGAAGADYKIDASADEIAEMSRLVAEALEAGAIGFATSRSVNHRSRSGKKIGSLTASEAEILGIADALRRTGKGVMQFVSDFRDLDAELGLMRDASRHAGRPVSLTLIQVDQRPDKWRRVLDWVGQANAEPGVAMRVQVAPRTVGLLIGLEGSMHPFVRCDAYRPIADLPLGQRVAAMRDPDLRRALMQEAFRERRGFLKMIGGGADKLFRLGDPPNYEPAPEESLGAEAARTGVDPFELVYDLLLERDGRELLYLPLGNYAAFNLDAAREMLLEDSVTLPGLSDGGAHVSFISDASFPTFLLTHWCRDRTRGEQLPLEYVVRRQTHDTARHVGLHDRGVLTPGYLADLNVIDFDNLRLRAPEMIHDLPAGGKRLMQRVEGYRYTLKRGAVTFEDGRSTGEMPGRLVRGAQPAPGL